MRPYDELVAEALAADVDGWGFGFLDGRATEERPPWGYARLLAASLAAAPSALDLDTGGGEVVAEAPTLPLRMARHESNARLVEDFLAQHPAVRKTLWPGSVRHPQHELARAQMRNFSGLLSFSVKSGSAEMARQLADRLNLGLGSAVSVLLFLLAAAIAVGFVWVFRADLRELSQGGGR
jgi:hypothetical protein